MDRSHDETLTTGLLCGPWASGFWVDLPIAVVSKSNFRFGSRDWSRLSRFEADLAQLVASVAPEGWDRGGDGQALGERPKVIALIAARTTIDVANISKSVLDALEGVLYVTDAQVASVVCLGERGLRHRWMSVGFATVAPDIALDELATSTVALVEQWSRRSGR